MGWLALVIRTYTKLFLGWRKFCRWCVISANKVIKHLEYISSQSWRYTDTVHMFLFKLGTFWHSTTNQQHIQSLHMQFHSNFLISHCRSFYLLTFNFLINICTLTLLILFDVRYVLQLIATTPTHFLCMLQMFPLKDVEMARFPCSPI